RLFGVLPRLELLVVRIPELLRAVVYLRFFDVDRLSDPGVLLRRQLLQLCQRPSLKPARALVVVALPVGASPGGKEVAGGAQPLHNLRGVVALREDAGGT